MDSRVHIFLILKYEVNETLFIEHLLHVRMSLKPRTKNLKSAQATVPEKPF